MPSIPIHVTIIDFHKVKVNEHRIFLKAEYKQKQKNFAILHMNNIAPLKEEETKPNKQKR